MANQSPPSERSRQLFPRKNFRQALESLGWAIRFNLISRRVELLPPADLAWSAGWPADSAGIRQWAPPADRHCYALCEDLVRADLMREKWLSLPNFMANLENAATTIETNPFLDDYLTPCEAAWDGVDRFFGDRHLLREMFSCADPSDPSLLSYERWVFRVLFHALALRALRPGYKFDTMVVLLGPGGCGKSAFAEAILPPEYREEYFTDQLDFSTDTDRQAEAIRGRLVVECAELPGLGRAETEHLKAMLSRRIDRVRPKWAVNVESYPRYSVIVGSANPEQGTGIFPDDPAARRRFLPLALLSGDPARIPQVLDPVRDQLYGQAIREVRRWLLRADPAADQYYRPWLPDDLTPIHQDLCGGFTITDDYRDNILAEWLMQTAGQQFLSPGQSLEFSLADLPSNLQVERYSRATAKALTRLGCHHARRRVAGAATRIWRYPVPESSL